MTKTVLLLHGWPQPVTKDHILHRYFTKKGYKVFSPYFFNSKYPFTKEGISKEIERNIKSVKLGVILGCSMGGFLIPTIAERYPSAKLVFVATAPYFKTNSVIFRILVRFSQGSVAQVLLTILKRIPRIVFVKLSMTVTPPSKSDLASYLKDMNENIKCFRSISSEKESEVIKLMGDIDNSKILRSLNNRTLILAGSNDKVMPLQLTKKLKRLLKNSELHINNRGHFNVIGKDSLNLLDNFLSG